MKQVSVAVVCSFVSLVASGSLSAQACVTLVADLRGAAAVADRPSAKPQDRWPIRLLECFPAGKTMMLGDGARVTLYYPASGEAVELRGPGKFQLSADAVRPLSSAASPAQLRLNDAFRDIKLDRKGLAPAGVRMRDLRIGLVVLGPKGIVLREAPLVFRWEPVPEAREYRLRVANLRRDVLFEGATATPELTLPPDARLPAGERLVWQVEAIAPSGHHTSAWEVFVLATPAARSLAAELDREISAPDTAERNLREVLLMQEMAAEEPEP